MCVCVHSYAVCDNQGVRGTWLTHTYSRVGQQYSTHIVGAIIHIFLQHTTHKHLIHKQTPKVTKLQTLHRWGVNSRMILPISPQATHFPAE